MVPKDEYKGPRDQAAETPAAAAPAPAAGNFAHNPEEESERQALAMRDAAQLAHDVELEAIAALALIRSGNSGGTRRLGGERGGGINPRIVDLHLREDDDKP